MSKTNRTFHRMLDTYNVVMVIRRCYNIVGCRHEYHLLLLTVTSSIPIILLLLITQQSNLNGQLIVLPTDGSEVRLSPLFDENSVSQRLIYAHFTQLTDSQGNQVKLILNYTVDYPSIVGKPINAIMKVTSATNMSLVRTSSFSTPIVANRDGTIQLATTLTDPNLTDIIVAAKFTDGEKMTQISNPVKLQLRLGEIIHPSPAKY
jgi:hypothetical protein